MEHSWKRQLGVFATSIVLVGGLGAATACNALAAGNGGPRASAAAPAGISLPAGSGFCENVKKFTADATANVDTATFTADIQQLLASAPAEIKPDVHKLLDPLLVTSGVASPDQVDHSYDIRQFQESTQRYQAYVRSHCAGYGIPGTTASGTGQLLSLSGSASGFIASAKVECTRLAGSSFAWQLSGLLNGANLEVTFNTNNYRGAGAYNATSITDDRGGLMTLQVGNVRVFSNGFSQGTFIVGGDQRSGSMSADLDDAGTKQHVQIKGLWRCS
jgi:hypothetical protein